MCLAAGCSCWAVFRQPLVTPPAWQRPLRPKSAAMWLRLMRWWGTAPRCSRRAARAGAAGAAVERGLMALERAEALRRAEHAAMEGRGRRPRSPPRPPLPGAAARASPQAAAGTSSQQPAQDSARLKGSSSALDLLQEAVEWFRSAAADPATGTGVREQPEALFLIGWAAHMQVVQSNLSCQSRCGVCRMARSFLASLHTKGKPAAAA
jgi:bacterioferritin-associated ferredoxin